ncbi:hypothetical protein GCM10010270_63220 [Streptomyces violaceus]|nr:hypothetical protein GCM10010270_63220 [Streptomyces janthinus]
MPESDRGVPRIPDEGADEGGRGLLLMSALSDKWGVGRGDPGQVVWCEWGADTLEV